MSEQESQWPLCDRTPPVEATGQRRPARPAETSRIGERRPSCHTPGVRCWNMTDLSEAPASESTRSPESTPSPESAPPAASMPGAYTVPTSLSPSRVLLGLHELSPAVPVRQHREPSRGARVATTKGTIVTAPSSCCSSARTAQTPEPRHAIAPGLRRVPGAYPISRSAARRRWRGRVRRRLPRLVEAYFAMEDPNAVREIGLELCSRPGRRLACAGSSTGSSSMPTAGRRHRLQDRPRPVEELRTEAPGRVHFYSFLCENVGRARRPPADVPEDGRDHDCRRRSR